MKVALLIVRNADGNFSVPYVGESASAAIAAMDDVPSGVECMVVRNPIPFKRKAGARKTLTVEIAPPAAAPEPVAAPEPAPVVQAPPLPPVEFAISGKSPRRK